MTPRTFGRLLATALLAGSLTACTASSPGATRDSSSTPPRTSDSSTTAAPVTIPRGSDYLALGDSVSFGFREQNSVPAPDYSNAANLVGFPELVARTLHLHVANASCPGETTSSLIDSSAPSNGCEDGYRQRYPLHVRYTGSQLAYGLAYLRAHPDTRLVTLMIGANDAFLCERTTKDNCLSQLPSLLRTVTRNVSTIVRDVRAAHYTGALVVLTYYAPNYDGIAATASSALNSAITAGAAGYHVRIADGYGGFERAAGSSGDSCRAGLLTRLAPGGCGVHPSAAGQRVLAAAVERALRS